MSKPRIPTLKLNLSARLLLWTMLFVMLAEVFIYVPSIARYRKVYLEARVADAHLAMLVLDASPGGKVPTAVEHALLEDAGLLGVDLLRPSHQLMLGMEPPVDAAFDLREERPLGAIREAFTTLAGDGDRRISVTGFPRNQLHNHDQELITAYLNEMALREGMLDYSWRILSLSVIISLITAAFLYLVLQWGMIRPMRRITRHLVHFSNAPENPRHTIQASGRQDELGTMEQELARMQGEIRSALAQQQRLAALGDAVSRINHDLRNILSTVGLLSERLANSDDPAVKKVAPMLATSVNKAMQICTSTVDLARGDQAINHREPVPLRELVDQVGTTLGIDPHSDVHWDNQIDSRLVVSADYDRLFRVFLNLGKNAAKALTENDNSGGTIRINARQTAAGTAIEVADDGPGLPANTLAHLFQPFVASSSKGGSGLGLATARDLMRAHQGELVLQHSGDDGTVFRLALPATPPQ